MRKKSKSHQKLQENLNVNPWPNYATVIIEFCLHDCNWTRTHNHLFHKWTLNHLVKLAKWLSCFVSTYPDGAFDCMLSPCHVRIFNIQSKFRLFISLEWLDLICFWNENLDLADWNYSLKETGFNNCFNSERTSNITKKIFAIFNYTLINWEIIKWFLLIFIFNRPI